MNSAVKFSQSYDEREDRILLVAEMADGATTRFWLTQRLANRLVQALVGIFENVDGKNVEAQHQPTVQSWEQAAAIAAFEPLAPVVAKNTHHDSLINTVNITSNGKGYALTLVGDHDQALMNLTGAELRQWFTVLHSHYVAAEWPQAMWPVWITTPEPTSLNTMSKSIN